MGVSRRIAYPIGEWEKGIARRARRTRRVGENVLARERHRRVLEDCLSSPGAGQTRRFNPITDWESVQREGRHVPLTPSVSSVRCLPPA
jgi:hypothetical protein